MLEPVQPLVVDLILLRAAQAGELRIAPGRGLMARVAQTTPSGRGLLSIAGELIEAELPKQVKPGDELRLVVRHVSEGKVELSLSDPRAPAMSPPPPAEVPLPGGAMLRVNEDGESGRDAASAGRPDTHVLSLQYETPALGAVDLRFVLGAGSLQLAVTLPAGRPAELARAEADQLRQALGDQLNRAVELVISPRREPLDVYA